MIPHPLLGNVKIVPFCEVLIINIQYSYITFNVKIKIFVLSATWLSCGKLGPLFNFVRDVPFRSCLEKRGAKRALLKVCHTHPTMMKLGKVIRYLKKIKKYVNHETYPFSPADINMAF